MKELNKMENQKYLEKVSVFMASMGIIALAAVVAIATVASGIEFAVSYAAAFSGFAFTCLGYAMGLKTGIVRMLKYDN